jgi:hypothetical protein
MDLVKRGRSTQVVLPNEKNLFELYAEAASCSDIVGTRLKFSKGEYTAEREDEEILEGTELIANLDELKIGWMKWERGKPVDKQMGRPADRYFPPKRADLGDNDPDEWETDDRGRPRDPWQWTNYLLLKEPEGDRLFTFVASSVGGTRAVGKLAGLYGKRLHHEQNEFPLIALKVGSYRHWNREFGKILACLCRSGRSAGDEQTAVEHVG